MNLYVGTSGYSYKEWKGKFYPEKLPDKQMLKFYGEHFNTVEINNTFYQMPKKNVLESWINQVPENFRFVIKANKRLTHVKSFEEKDLIWFTENIRSLGNQLGPVLFQFPPYFRADQEKVNTFLKLIPDDIKSAFEFRHTSWFNDDIFSLFRNKNIALVLSETDENKNPELIKTTDWGYLRLRRTDYESNDIKNWLLKVQEQNWKEAYIFFKHEDEGSAPKFAMEFLEYYHERSVVL